MQRNVKMDPRSPITIFTTTGEKKMNDNGALLVLCGPLFSLFTFSIPPFNYKTPSSPILSCNFSSMEFRPRNGFNLEEDDTAGDFPVAGDDRKRRSGGGGKRGGPGTGGAAPPCCQADACPAVLTDAKRYHRRHKVCEFHAKSAVVLVAGLRQRFCQQCSRFHELSEFDEAKRSCRRRLAGHNERRRKSSSTEPLGDGSTPATSRLGSSSSSSSGIGGQIQCRASTDENSRASGISLPTASNSSAAAAAYKQHLQIG